MKRLLKDAWFQLFAFVGLISGAMTAHALYLGLVRAPSLPSLGPDLLAGLSLPRGGGLEPRTPGRWVVDASGAADADSDELGPVLASAREGDRVLVRPGTYREAVRIDRPLAVEGTGKEPGDVLILSASPATVSVSSGPSLLRNLSVALEAGGSGAALVLTASTLTLSSVQLQGGGTGSGAAVAGGTLALEGSVVSTAAAAVALSGPGAQARLLRTLLSQSREGLLVEDGAAALVEDSTMRRIQGAGLRASGQASAAVRSSLFSLCGHGVRAEEGARVEVRGSTVSESGRGLSAEGAEVADFGSLVSGSREAAAEASAKGTLRLDQTRLQGSRRDGVRAEGGSTVILNRAVVSGAEGAGIALRDGSELYLARSEVRGSGRCGIELQAAEAFLDFALIEGNDCGVAFTGRGKLQSNEGRFEGNAKGPLLYSRQFLSGIYLRGTGNTPPDFQALFR